MDENKKNIPAEEEPTILTLHDDEGNEEEFEFLDVIEYQDRFCCALPGQFQQG